MINSKISKGYSEDRIAELCNVVHFHISRILGLFSKIITHKLGGKLFYNLAELQYILWAL